MSDYGMGMQTEENYGFETPNGHTGVAAHEDPVGGPQEDDFWGNAFDGTEIEAAIKSDLLPEGAYKVLGVETDDRKNPFNGQGEISCKVQISGPDGGKMAVRYSLQPKKTYNESNGKVAWNHILFKQVVQAYHKAYGALPKGADALKTYMEQTTLEYRLVPNLKGTGMQVMGIAAVAGEDIPF